MKAQKKKPQTGGQGAQKNDKRYDKSNIFLSKSQAKITTKIRHRIAQRYLYFLEEAYLPRPYTQARSLMLDRALARYEGVLRHARN